MSKPVASSQYQEVSSLSLQESKDLRKIATAVSALVCASLSSFASFVISAMAWARHPGATPTALGGSLLTTSSFAIVGGGIISYVIGKKLGATAGFAGAALTTVVAAPSFILGALTVAGKVAPKTAGIAAIVTNIALNCLVLSSAVAYVWAKADCCYR